MALFGQDDISEALLSASAQWGKQLDVVDPDSDTTQARQQQKWRVRVLFAADGRFRFERFSLATLQSPFRVAIAPAPICSTDPFLSHKTTVRHVYDHFASQKGTYLPTYLPFECVLIVEDDSQFLVCCTMMDGWFNAQSGSEVHDVLLFNERHEITEATFANVAIQLPGSS
jgi:hypothetical protein